MYSLFVADGFFIDSNGYLYLLRTCKLGYFIVYFVGALQRSSKFLRF